MATVKIPLAVKKNLRDSYTDKVEELEAALSADDCLGTPWKLDIDPTAVFANADDGSYGRSSLGDCLHAYVDNAISRLKYYREQSGAESMQELNDICSGRTLTLGMDESKKFSYNGVTVDEDRNLKILITPGNVGVNIYDCLEPGKLRDALNEAPPPEGAGVLSFTTKGGIRERYDPAIGEVTEKIRKILACDDLELDPNWDDTFTKIKAANEAGKSVLDDWESSMGHVHLSYFDGLLSQLEWQGFSDPDYQEGFQAEIPEKKVVVRVVDKLEQGAYNECVIEDGVLYLQTVPENWGVNTTDAAKELQNKL